MRILTTFCVVALHCTSLAYSQYLHNKIRPLEVDLDQLISLIKPGQQEQFYLTNLNTKNQITDQMVTQAFTSYTKAPFLVEAVKRYIIHSIKK
ncbi:hypothetical protein SAMN05421640_1198 [Ekhidna lutea]|uniref:Uncharacterized protein n=1 Tax=Ekhidna lutea TaxID=447679 RepID=A0A239H8L5_EKHLU|nr:hypothetical protein SAMN05421640_1198 [Ekhidna lutea]